MESKKATSVKTYTKIIGTKVNYTKKSGTKNSGRLKHPEDQDFTNNEIDNLEVYILDEEKRNGEWVKEGTRRNGLEGDSYLLAIGQTKKLNKAEINQTLVFAMDKSDFHKKGFEIDFDHGVKTEFSFKEIGNKVELYFKILEVDPVVNLHIAGNIGHPDW